MTLLSATLRLCSQRSALRPPRALPHVSDAGTLPEDRVLDNHDDLDKACAKAWPIFGGEPVINDNADKMPRSPESVYYRETKKPAGCIDNRPAWMSQCKGVANSSPHGSEAPYGGQKKRGRE
jgi:hypothetical protein